MTKTAFTMENMRNRNGTIRNKRWISLSPPLA